MHDVYENCDEPAITCTSGSGSNSSSSCHNGGRPPLSPSVMRFIADLEPGSFVCDVGSGDGRYLSASTTNPLIYTIGVDRCFRLTKVARAKGGEVSSDPRSL